MIEYLQQPGNALFVLLVFAIMLIDYILELIKVGDHYHRRPSLFAVLLSTVIIVFVAEMLTFLVKLALESNSLL